MWTILRTGQQCQALETTRFCTISISILRTQLRRTLTTFCRVQSSSSQRSGPLRTSRPSIQATSNSTRFRASSWSTPTLSRTSMTSLTLTLPTTCMKCRTVLTGCLPLKPLPRFTDSLQLSILTRSHFRTLWSMTIISSSQVKMSSLPLLESTSQVKGTLWPTSRRICSGTTLTMGLQTWWTLSRTGRSSATPNWRTSSP